ncbi:nucleotide pyrophosphohydrolase [Rhizohabitans arisaemae]|uniref:nucleotide pyrophosphohydrolase n=1 Tax=Rhizohabitans arisaemae TaxID=2720610 RepID=UPI0024B185CD|nr:nucleotide pyrophosphohydrolase [Rhizohabitans arisaemae]
MDESTPTGPGEGPAPEDRLAAELREFVAERHWQRYMRPKNLVMALSAEVGELSEHFTWTDPDGAADLTPEQRAEVADEIADVYIYLLRLAGSLGVDPVEAALAKLVKARLKYPARPSGADPDTLREAPETPE